MERVWGGGGGGGTQTGAISVLVLIIKKLVFADDELTGHGIAPATMPIRGRTEADTVTTVAPQQGDGPTIREAERADLLAVFRIEQQSFPQPWPFSAFEGYLGDRGFLVAHDDGVVGYVVADTVPNHGRPLGHVKDIAVHEDRRGEGLGRSLLQRALAVLEAQGVSSVKLEVRESNEPARQLYDEMGFVHRRTIPRYYSDGEDALVLVRD